MNINPEHYTHYKEVELNNLFNDIKNRIENCETTYCHEISGEKFTNIDEAFIKLSLYDIKYMFKNIDTILKIINDTITEYYSILNSQIDLLSITEYNEMRVLIKETENLVNDDLEKRLNPEKLKDSLTRLCKNIKKGRNPDDICKIILDIDKQLPMFLDLYIIKPEAFILEGEFIP